ncbi:pilus assembly protein TadG-related protein [Nocardioides sp. 1609]|uniref:pilus assembly protein TadG-related protein n=1 Tax=Nocardioides sp. 1609 TaxID=2508327 RepID=UPI001431F228|nr:pilus assembly protein TadG-related protein [Nocardioides sp. 1609]
MRPRDEDGAIAIVAAAVMVVVLGVAAFVVDLGMQRVARQDLQALADVVALDLARMLDGERTAGQVEGGSPSLAAALQASRARNDDDVVGDEDELVLTATLLVEDPRPDAPSPWRTADDDEVPDAVRVVASTEVAFGFAAVVGVDTGGASRESVAAAESSACFHVGSFTAAVERANPSTAATLDALLGLTLPIEDYLDLARAEVALDDVAEGLPRGTASFVDRLPVRDLVRAIAEALPVGSAARRVLDRVDGTDVVRLDDVVKVGEDDRLALRNATSLLDLVAPLLLSARGEYRTSVPAGVDDDTVVDVVGVPGVQRVCAAEEARGASVSATYSDNLDLFADQPGRRRGFTTLEAEVEAVVDLGGALFSLPSGVECRDVESGQDRFTVEAADGRGTGSLGVTVTLDGAVDPLPDGVDALSLNDLVLELDAPLPGAPQVPLVELRVPDNVVDGARPPVPGTTGATFGGLGAVPSIRPVALRLRHPRVEYAPDTRVARQAVRAFLRDLRGDLDATIDTRVDDGVATVVETEAARLTRVLGTTRGGADLYSEERPTCGGVRLVE